MIAMKSPRQVPLATLLLAVSLAVPTVGQGMPVRLGTSRGVEGLWASRQNATVMKDGRFAAIWTQFLQGPDPGAIAQIAHVQYVRGDGSTALGPLGRAVTSSNAAFAVAVVAHAEEGVLVALERFDPAQSGTSRVVVQRLDGEGRPRWHQGAFAAPVSGLEIQGGTALLASSDGGAFVCFTRAAFVPQYVANVYCQRFSPDGRRLWGKRAVRAVTSTRTLYPPLAIADGKDGLLVFWQEEFGGGAGRVTFRGQRLGPDGSRLWGDEGRIVYTRRLPRTFGFFPPFALVPDGRGGAILAFNDWPGPPSPIRTERVVIVQRVSGDGDNLWGSGGLAVTSGPQRLDSLIAGPDGGAFVGVITIGANGSSARLAFHRVTADGRSIWPADGVPIVDPAVASDQDADLYSLGSFDGGVLRLAWQHYVPLYRFDVRFGALDADGHRLAAAAPAGVILTPAVGQNNLGGFAVNPETGTAFAAWTRFERGDVDVLGAVYSFHQ